jgi:hypothetical protein
VVAVSAKARVNVMERPDRVAVAAEAESPTTTGGSIREATMVGMVKVEATTIVANKTSPLANRNPKMPVPRRLAITQMAQQRRSGGRFLIGLNRKLKV